MLGQPPRQPTTEEQLRLLVDARAQARSDLVKNLMGIDSMTTRIDVLLARLRAPK